jgi:hypothetical protein
LFAIGVPSNDPDPIPPVVGADSRSRNNDRPCGVAERIQVSEYPVKPTVHTDDSRHILKKAVTGPGASNNSRKFRPEIAVISRALLSSGCGPRLAGEAAGEEVKTSLAK